MFLLSRLLKHLIRTGILTVTDAEGRRHVFSGTPTPAVSIRLHDPTLPRRLFLNPSLVMGEAYMEGLLTVEDGASVNDLIDLVTHNIGAVGMHPFNRIRERLERLFRQIDQMNGLIRARKNVAHHYDLSGALYELFLDPTRQYSCAYFRTGRENLETAQRDKMRHIAAKLLLAPGMKVLDIGSGWGGLALYLAREHGVAVTGLTLSEEQLAYAKARAQREGLADRVQFALRDYRDETGTYDRIVSVGMFEHVGVNHFRDFFAQIRDRLTPDGIALLHTIGRGDGPGRTDPWIKKYIFPGGYIPALSEISRAIERERLKTTDVEVLRFHYATTIGHWRTRFAANRAKIRAIYDERFCRMWEYYLAASEASFRHLDNVVYQVQMARSHDAVPLIRDYLHSAGPDSAFHARRRLNPLPTKDNSEAA
ncbi:MAG: class I SAM-dependent methyltransferase [Alphaproteobacteria bacterium]|nr:class I SAM-dependent methyltransferase [Alphaproteobacteria bacterium]